MSNRMSVLIVDDEDYIRDSIKLLLEDDNYNCIEANNGYEALELLEKREDEINVILSDIKMPEMDGITLLKIIKEKYPNKVVIIITGYPSLETAVETLKMGADDYITKPFNVNEVSSKLQKAIESSKLKKEVILLNDVVSIYESTKLLSSTISQEEIFLEVHKNIIGEWGMSGFYVKLFDRKLSFQYADSRVIDYVNEEFSPKNVIIIFKKVDVFQFNIQYDNKGYSCFLFPMYSKNGLWGIFCIYCDAKKKISDIRKHIMNTYVGEISLALQNSLAYIEISDGYLQTVTSLSNAVDAKDSYTRGHSENVKKYSTMIVEEMGFNSIFEKYMTYAGLLHDIGKIGIDTYIIVKPDKLSSIEFEEIKKHSLYGKEILEPITFLGDVPYYVLFHHEKLDGSGYPYGLTAHEIPIGSKILAVADSYDAMTTDRSYRPRRNAIQAVEELDRCVGTQFDRDVVAAFKSALKKKGYI
ncbi:MAG: response regulator [Calditerrivibrio sp.]|nr:response regulator [Calditerrivibrio sp.]